MVFTCSLEKNPIPKYIFSSIDLFWQIFVIHVCCLITYHFVVGRKFSISVFCVTEAEKLLNYVSLNARERCALKQETAKICDPESEGQHLFQCIKQEHADKTGIDKILQRPLYEIVIMLLNNRCIPYITPHIQDQHLYSQPSHWHMLNFKQTREMAFCIYNKCANIYTTKFFSPRLFCVPHFIIAWTWAIWKVMIVHKYR